jgi:hypothetical protein
MTYNATNRSPQRQNLIVKKKVDLHNYFEEVQRKAENEAMTFLQTVS